MGRRNGYELRRGAGLTWAILIAIGPLGVSADHARPFLPIETARALAERQGGGPGGCLANFYPCVDRGTVFQNVCCENGQVCALDANHNPACCPLNAVCTGTAPATFVAPGTATVSFVANTYFSFPYVATSFANQQACSSAVSQCSRNYEVCTSQLEAPSGGSGGGGGFGVTVVVPGGSTVVGNGGGGNNNNAGAGLPTATATSVCSSLSSVACSGLRLDMCTGGARTTNGGFYFGTRTANAAMPARGTPTGLVGVGVAGAVAAGFGLGVV
ncbi:hypothetical protein VTK73DRAFT_4420 [Phialemonium thermophilum]|uniref:Gpi-anchored protein n=1 Tax=Phialemonium thermophilum TaxID=223376 RepID=A0ABR3WU52_9PEZI